MYQPGDFSYIENIPGKKMFTAAYEIIEKYNWWHFFDVKKDATGKIIWNNSKIEEKFPELRRAYVLRNIEDVYWPVYVGHAFRRTIIGMIEIRELGWNKYVQMWNEPQHRDWLDEYHKKFDYFLLGYYD